MNVGRLFQMTKKDIRLVTREGFFLFMIIMPIFMSLALNAALGSVGTSAPTVGVFGESELIPLLEQEPSIHLVTADSEQGLRNNVLEGEYDAGIAFESGSPPRVLVSGKSLLNDRLTVGATLVKVYREQMGAENVVSFDTKVVGGEEYPLRIRMVPFLLIISAMVGGLILSSSLVEERELKTLNAVLVTPITPLEVVMAKTLFGLFLGLVLGTIILVLNGSLTGGLYLVLLFLILGTLFAVGLGLIGGVMMKNITDLITRMKIVGVFLWFPALVLLFPSIPQWLGKFFPTYYFVHPILAITQDGATLSDIWWEGVILLAIDVVVLLFASRVLRERMTGKTFRV
ncbi:MAG: ABC transporter permease [Theionarchaea archaeon]|nr:ABC transporter permease [Theionarchaea archaeon]MBU7039053.1 ABC transporter permease [Theionarchaea archaeon]